MGNRWGTGMLVAVTVSALAACAPPGDGGGASEGEAAAAPGDQTAMSTAASPDTTGPGLWAHLQDEDYRANWDLWPGKGELYDGGEPHGLRLTMYVNAAALDALHQGVESLPDGAIVVKENYTPDGTLAAITTMYKRTGYNPEHADWYFVKYLPDGSLDQAPNGMELQGRLPGCQGCHIARAANDYLFSEVEGS